MKSDYKYITGTTNFVIPQNDEQSKECKKMPQRSGGKCEVSRISPQDVKNWMNAGRRFCLDRGIYWKSFSRFIITKHTLHPSILEGVRKKIQDKAADSEATWNITTYIEKIIIEMMPKEERYEVMKKNLSKHT